MKCLLTALLIFCCLGAIATGHTLEIAIVLIYALPAMIANFRFHRDREWIGSVNILLGWTIVGWIAALNWALRPNRGGYY